MEAGPLTLGPVPILLALPGRCIHESRCLHRAIVHALFVIVVVLQQPCAAQQTVYGAIESLDVDLGTITLLLPPKHEPKQFNLAKPNLPATNALGQPLKLAVLREKQRVALTLDEADDVAAIRLDDNCLWAYVMKVEAKEQQLAIKFGHVQRTLSVPAKTAVLLDGEKVDLSDLKVGQGIKAIFAPDQTLVQIQCGKGISGVSPYHRCDFLCYVDAAGRYSDFHALRHSFITMVGKMGVSPREHQDLARHSTYALTSRYSHSRFYDLAAAVQGLPIPSTGQPSDSQSMAATGTDSGKFLGPYRDISRDSVRLHETITVSAGKQEIPGNQRDFAAFPGTSASTELSIGNYLQGDSNPPRKCQKKIGVSRS